MPLFSKKTDGLVEISSVDSSIILDLRYATTDNFTGQKLYSSAHCFLRLEVAQALHEIQQELAQEGLGLKVFDGYRPQQVQQKMWDLIRDERYVANPAKGGRHTRGTAVDLTIVTKNGSELDMGTPFDDFTEKAHRDYQNLSLQVLANRKKLTTVMNKHGFVGLPTEWWHFDYQGWEKHTPLDITFEQLK